HKIARADLEVLAGRPEDAMRTLADVEVALLPVDAPLIAYEAERVRARAMGAIDRPIMATQHAKAAMQIATDQGWPQRIRWVAEEFRVSRPGSVDAESVTSSRDEPAAALYRRRLEALQQVSLASATVLEPRGLARVALDETLRILGADRAFLFLLDLDLDQLVPHVGRDGEGNDIRELTGYSSTLVERVRRSGEPLVVTGSEEGVALGSQSVQVHGLRSILIAPLKFDGVLRGVVYLDSRVAKGVFTRDDVDILKAITNHIAVSLETARAAQLEVAVQTARRQRDVAETLRAAMADQSSSLDPDEVMRRLLNSLIRTLGGDSAVLLTQQDDALVVTAAEGPTAAVGTPVHPMQPDLVGLAGPRVRTVAPGEDPPLGGLIGTPRSWWAIQVPEHGEAFGILLVGAARGGMTEAQSQIAAAIAGQGLTAYENARLFSQVRQLATIDGLTGLYNRNHFFAEADRQLSIARWTRRPMAVLMVDIDHFKRINDTYGHPVGDEVIRVVADRLGQFVRDGVVGRYGGEEFAVITPAEKPVAAELAERLREVVSGNPVPTAAGALPVTISVGVACPDGAEPDLGQLLNRADTALYQAKQAGRDCVRVAA
ncbi:sensor domain-containing diguanylate cyclase, partial [Actinoplanes sp. NPDC051633]|uniref:sensor domain-containing diguanylate cyclase n=1 Tax=Actinoplanes sp. NPDC051633 TaxID=3155670 RepID=UPI00343CD234